ncbi:hypothetical protein GCM10025734_01100 [Kitasatospora paranensis]
MTLWPAVPSRCTPTVAEVCAARSRKPATTVAAVLPKEARAVTDEVLEVSRSCRPRSTVPGTSCTVTSPLAPVTDQPEGTVPTAVESKSPARSAAEAGGAVAADISPPTRAVTSRAAEGRRVGARRAVGRPAREGVSEEELIMGDSCLLPWWPVSCGGPAPPQDTGRGTGGQSRDYGAVLARRLSRYARSVSSSAG